MKTITPVCGLLLILVVAGAAEDKKPDDRTFGMFNGRFWNICDRGQRINYVFGMFDLAHYMSRYARASDSNKELVDRINAPGKFSYSELAAEITKLYEDPANVVIPIVIMETEAAAIMNGADPADRMAQARKWSLSTGDH